MYTNGFYYDCTDAPEIEVERPFVHTGVGHDAQLICVVHAEPVPTITWYKESTQLGTTEQHSKQVRFKTKRLRELLIIMISPDITGPDLILIYLKFEFIFRIMEIVTC